MAKVKISTSIAAASMSIVLIGAAAPAFAKAHNNGLSSTERVDGIGHQNGTVTPGAGSSSLYVLTTIAPLIGDPNAKNSGQVIKQLVPEKKM